MDHTREQTNRETRNLDIMTSYLTENKDTQTEVREYKTSKLAIEGYQLKSEERLHGRPHVIKENKRSFSEQQDKKQTVWCAK